MQLLVVPSKPSEPVAKFVAVCGKIVELMSHDRAVLDFGGVCMRTSLAKLTRRRVDKEPDA